MNKKENFLDKEQISKLRPSEKKRLEEFDEHPAIARSICALLRENSDTKGYIKAITIMSAITFIFSIIILVTVIALMLSIK